jgi:Ca2+-binding RTX toxin-like protein
MNLFTFLRPTTSSASARRRAPVLLSCEPLEARDVPALTLPGPGPTIDQTLRINGTAQNDKIVVDPMPWGMLRIRITTEGNTTEWTRRQMPYIRLSIDAGEGDDKVYNNTSLPSTILGGAGNDVLYGGSSGDTLRGGSNSSNDIQETFVPDHLVNDYLYGRGGEDWLYGEEGGDQLFGGEGADHLYGGEHDDFLMGEGGADYFSGDDGDDILMAHGDGLWDEIWTGSGADTILPDWREFGLGQLAEELIQDLDASQDKIVFMM